MLVLVGRGDVQRSEGVDCGVDRQHVVAGRGQSKQSHPQSAKPAIQPCDARPVLQPHLLAGYGQRRNHLATF